MIADGWCSPGFAVAFAGVIGASLAVAGASALNMWLERGKDPLMSRTRTRPLATRRLPERTGLAFAIGLCALALAVLWLFTNPLTTLRAGGAIDPITCYRAARYRERLAPARPAVAGSGSGIV